MQKHEYNISARLNGNNLQPLADALVTVVSQDTGLPAALYQDDELTPIPQPLTTDNNGFYSFKAADGKYTVTYLPGPNSSRFGPITREILLEDPKDNPYLTVQEMALASGASKVGFQQSGTGAVARKVEDKLREAVSVLDFGAKGDGVTDDTAAIQAAIDYMQSRPYGGNVFIPAGKYKLTAPINAVVGKFLRLHGEGKASKLFAATAFGSAILAGATASAANGSIFEDFMILGAASGIGNGMTLTAANIFQINRVWFEAQGIAVTLTSSYAVEMNGCVFDVSASEAIKATTSAHNLVIRTCNFYTCGVANSKAAINLTAGSNNIVIDDNDFENCYRVASFQDCTSLSLKGNYVEYCDASDFEFLGTCQGVELNNNWIALGAVPFVIANVTGMAFVYNTIYNHTVNIGSGVSQLHAAHNPTIGSGVVNINYLRFESRASGGGIPSLRPSGPDTDIQARVSSKGAADVSIYTNTESNLAATFGHVANAVNWARHVPSSAGQPLEVIAQGASADIDYRITPKGAGRVRFGTLAANADAPITGYIEIKDAGGTVRKLAVIA